MTVAALKRSYVHDRLQPEIARVLASRRLDEPAPNFTQIKSLNLFGWWNPSIVLASLGINLLGLALPLSIFQIYERIVPNSATDTLIALVGGLVVIAVLDGLLRAARSYAIAWQGSRFEHAVGCRAIDCLARTSPSEYKARPVGRHLEALQAIDTLRDFYGGAGLINFLEIPFVLIFLAMIFLIGGSLGFVPVVLFLACGGLAVLLGNRLKSLVTQRNDVDMHRFNFILEVLNGLQHVKSQALEALMLRRYERLQAGAATVGDELVRAAALSQACGAFFSYFVLFSTAATGALMVLDGSLSQGGLAACSLLAGRAVQPFLRSMAFWAQYQTIRVAKQNLEHLLDYPAETSLPAAATEQLTGQLRFENVSVAYSDRVIFKAVNIRIDAGETILLRGATGGGKSTFLELCNGLTAPSCGVVRLDGVDLRNLDVASVRQKIAYLPEKTVLFRGTILDNLTLFDPARNMDRAMELVVELGLDRAVARLPGGFATEVGDDLSDLLPQGVRQQIGIVRALARQPRIILFDQPNAGLDMKADQRLLDLLKRLKGTATLVMVTHRPSYIALADREVRLQGGRLFDTAAAPAHIRQMIRAASPGLRLGSADGAQSAPARTPSFGATGGERRA